MMGLSKFQVDEDNGCLLCRVTEAMAAALSIPVEQLVIFALYERQACAHAPMLACCCENMHAILKACEIAQQVMDERHSKNTSAHMVIGIVLAQLRECKYHHPS